MLSYNIGTEIAYILGNYTDYETTPKIVVGLTVVFLIALYFLPETPTFLIKQSKISVRKRIHYENINCLMKLIVYCRKPKNLFDFIKTDVEIKTIMTSFSLKWENCESLLVALKQRKKMASIGRI